MLHNLLKKILHLDNEVITIITMYPHLDRVFSHDLTTILILNQLANSEKYCALYFVNLLSNITTPINLMKAVKEADTVLIAWGAYGKKAMVQVRVNGVLEILKPHQKKISILTNPQTNEIMHPLNPMARKALTIK